MRLLPIGIQDFVDIRERGFVYVDKTARIHQLITGSGKQFFLSRPRRFGKSLLCSTFGAFFEGMRDLFGELAGRPALAIDSLEWDWKRYPVIRLDLNAGNYIDGGTVALTALLDSTLSNIAMKYDLEPRGRFAADRFMNLVFDLHRRCGRRAVVIIDEYDKPLLETMANPDLHTALRNELKGFYGVLKPSDEHLRFVFLTGITEFSRVSIFSDLNHLSDLTLDPKYADICGITQNELETCFEPEIASVLENTGKSSEEYFEELRRFYNGYKFSKKPLAVYNPFGLLNHFNNDGDFSPYWYETATPTFLVDMVMKQKINIAELGELSVRDEDFRKYDCENMNAVPLLYQAGYLTITDYDEERNRYALDYPNLEVRSSFTTALVRQYMNVPEDRSNALIFKLPDTLMDGDVDGAIETLRQFLAVIPYDIIRETENYYQTAIHLIFTMLGLNCRSEVRLAAGRIDALVETRRFVYCFEFKLDKSAAEALAQIDTKDYLLPWNGSGKKLFKVGVDFNHEKRNIGEWMYETVEK